MPYGGTKEDVDSDFHLILMLIRLRCAFLNEKNLQDSVLPQ